MARTQVRAERKIVFFKAYMRDGEDWAEINVGNISSSGLMIKCRNPPPAGSLVEIRRRGAAIAGRVIWATQSRCGVVSDEPINVAEFTAGSALDTHMHRFDTPARGKLWHWRHSS